MITDWQRVSENARSFRCESSKSYSFYQFLSLSGQDLFLCHRVFVRDLLYHFLPSSVDCFLLVLFMSVSSSAVTVESN